MPHAAGEAEDVGGKELPPVRGGNEEGKKYKMKKQIIKTERERETPST